VSANSRAERRIRQHIANLASEDKEVSVPAEKSLIRYYGVRALPHLISACDHPMPQVRYRAVWALACTHDPRAYETVMRLTSDPDDRVNYDAILGLGVLGDTRAIGPLVEMVLQNDGPADGALRDFGLLAIEPFRRLIDASDAGVRLCAANGLGYIAEKTGSQECVALLRDCLGDPDEYVRNDARYWLEELSPHG
jgi:HEAT repeat protein